MYPNTRLRRLRNNSQLRQLVRETTLSVNHLVLPLFIRHGVDIKKAIPSMPGQFQISIDRLEEEIKNIVVLNIQTVILFGIPEKKDAKGQDSYNNDGIIQAAIRKIKQIAPQLLVISDICLCEYTDHGHCGVINAHEQVANDKTLSFLAKQAVSHAKAGVDIVAPSGMMDGMVQAIRKGLDAENFNHIPILSYAVKYASSFYGPFREAAEGAPQFGDRQTYQMDMHNAREALRECDLDIGEGADLLMVKPAHTYLDVIFRVKAAFPQLPLGAYHTSGEYALIKAAARKGWLDERKATLEVLTAIRRAGADFIITYFALDAALWLQQEE